MLEVNVPDKIDLLLGANIFYELLKPERIKIKDSQLLLVNSVFGYIVTGNLDSINETKVHCGLIRDEDLNKTLEKFWKVEEVEQPIVKNKERLICEEHYANTHFRTKEGKYVVSMPLKKRNPRVWITVWCESEHESPKIYELSTVTYGTVSAPYLAQRTLTQLSMDEEANFPIAASVLRNNLYMDDVLCGAATLKEAIVLRQQLKGILNSAGMELHKLCANHEKLSPDPEQNYNFATLTETKTLGVSWEPNLDCFLIKVKVCLDSSYTKRDVLSTIAKILDPVGLMAPNINNIEIPRRILLAFPEVIEIHGFADASERCYGAEVYCKSKNLKSETLVRLITSKSRVAPIKSLAIPRLELCAAVLLAKLVKRVVAALQLETAELYLWSDSMIVLAWLRKEPMDL
ncbi:uncharacterized protein TNCV_4998331 [Trichonephila clavipes]|nr:uncharacterized protein TNCV_4998331 [Trichonephila clavipes]